MIRTIDYAALGSPVTKPDITAYRAELAAKNPGATSGNWVAIVVVVIVIVVFGSMFVGVMVPLLFTLSQSGGVGALVATFVVLFGVAAIIIGGIVLLVRYYNGTRFERWVRLDRFAKANGLVFSPSDPNPQYPGAIFGLGRSRAAYDHMRSASERFLDFGNYRYTTGSGKNSKTHTWGFMALQLDRALPHMVLDSKANNGLFGTNLPATFAKDQVLSLEGDFDNFFTLYCPKEYERDALYVFTPDLMALCIDHAAPFDIEIVDKWMFVYSASPFVMTTPHIYQRLFGIIDTVGAKTLSQTDRYADERVSSFTANVVAPQGTRLKRGVSVGAIVIGASVLAFWILPHIITLALSASGR